MSSTLNASHIAVIVTGWLVDASAWAATLAPGWWVASALVVWLGLRSVRAKWRRGRGARTLRARARRAQRAEQQAAGVLRSHGYQILGEQVDHSWQVGVGDDTLMVSLRADYLVRRGRRRFVAEVKTGALAPSVETAATRRQLLEYRLAYPVDGILLVDMEAITVEEITFECDRAVEGAPWWRVTLGASVGAAAGAAAAWWMLAS